MIDPFILKAVAAGVGVAVIAGILGCFVIWRRMAYFGDSLAHSALLGVALGLALGINTNLSTIIICIFFAVILVWLQQKKILATDTLLGIMAHSALSIGMVTMSLLGQRIDLHAYLFGDILTVTTTELYWIYGGGAVVIALLVAKWSSLVLMTINEDLAMAEKIPTLRNQLLFMFLMTIIVAVSIRIIGILLIASMLVIPAATARMLVRSPEAMAIGAAILGVIAVILGIFCSMAFDTPSGPTIVTACAVLFVIGLPITYMVKK